MELATAEGRFKGYAKPVMKNVDIYGTSEQNDSPLRKLWEGIVELAANALENKPEDQVAARIPLSGTIENPKANIFETFVSVVHNAFVAAFARSLEGSISIRDVRKNLSKYDSKEEAKDDKKKEGEKSDRKKERPRSVGPKAA